MTVPTPATDAQLQKLAQHGAQTWNASVLRYFDNRYRGPNATVSLLSGVPAGARMSLWTDLLVQFVNQRRTELADVVARHAKPIADQAFAALQAQSPRPTDQDIATPATANQLSATAVAATAAQQEAAVAIAAIDKHIHEFAENASTLEQLRAALDAQFAPLRTGLADGTARALRIRTLIDGFPQHDALLAAISTEMWAALASAMDKLQLLTRSGDDADHALRSLLTGTGSTTLADQQAAVTAAYNAPVAAAQTANTALTTRLAALGESAITFFCTPPPPPPPSIDPAFAGDNFVGHFAEGLQAYLALSTSVVSTFRNFYDDSKWGGYEVMDAVRRRFPVDTPAQTLADALTALSSFRPTLSDYGPDYTEIESDVTDWASDHNVPQPVKS